MENVVTHLLFEHRVRPHVATEKAPSEMLMGRQLRTTLDIVRSNNKDGQLNKYREQMMKNYDKGKKARNFAVG